MSLSFSAPSPWSTGSSPRDNSARCDTSRGLGARAGVAARARGLRAVSGSSARLRFSCAAGSSLFAEERDGGRYLEAVVTCFERGRRGGLVGLLCTDRCAGLSIESREFPLLLHAAASATAGAAADLPGLPPALASLEDLHQKVRQQPAGSHVLTVSPTAFKQDIRLMYIHSFDDSPGAPSGSFYVHDLFTERGEQVDATYAQVLGMCVRFGEPFFLERRALLSMNARCLAAFAAEARDGAASAGVNAASVEADAASLEALAAAHTCALGDASDSGLSELLAALRTLYSSRKELFQML